MCLDKALTVGYSHLQGCRSCRWKTRGGTGEEFEKARLDWMTKGNWCQGSQIKLFRTGFRWYLVAPHLKSLKTKWCEIHINVLPLHRSSPNGENAPSILAFYRNLHFQTEEQHKAHLSHIFLISDSKFRGHRMVFLDPSLHRTCSSQWSGTRYFVIS